MPASVQTLESLSAKTETGNGSALTLRTTPHSIAFELDVTVAATAAGDTLDVFVQTKVGSNWVDVVHFSQVLGNGGAKRYFAKTVAALAESQFENASALSAGSIRNLVGDEYRARWAIVEASAASFTFSVKASMQV